MTFASEEVQDKFHRINPDVQLVLVELEEWLASLGLQLHIQGTSTPPYLDIILKISS